MSLLSNYTLHSNNNCTLTCFFIIVYVFRYLQMQHHSFFRPQNFSLSKILLSIDTWHLFGLISWISGVAYVFSRFSFFEFQLSLFRSFLVFSDLRLLSHNRLFLDLFMFYITVYFHFSFFFIVFPFKTLSFLFGLCARLNGQLACQFSSVSYHTQYVSYQCRRDCTSGPKIVCFPSQNVQ